MKICSWNFYLRATCTVLMTSQLVFAFATSSCPHGYYKNPNRTSSKQSLCLRCSLCPSGQGIEKPCTTTRDTVCSLCKAGKTFSDGSIFNNYCRPCQSCAENQEQISACTINKDTKCGNCKTGLYWNSIYNECEPCSWCFPEVFKHTDALIISQCVRVEIPESFHCAKLLSPPYQQMTWLDSPEFPNKDSNRSPGSSSGSGDDVSSHDVTGEVVSFPSDDEDVLLSDDPTRVVSQKTSDLNSVASFSKSPKISKKQKKRRKRIKKGKKKKQHRLKKTKSEKMNNKTSSPEKSQTFKVSSVKSFSYLPGNETNYLFLILLSVLGALLIVVSGALIVTCKKYSNAVKKIKKDKQRILDDSE